MAYCTVSQVRARLPLITADVKPDPDVQGFIDQSGAVVDGYLRDVYYLPLTTPVDPLLAFITLDFACGLLLENVYGEDTPNDVDHPATLKSRALTLLNAIRSRELYLDHARRPRGNPPSVTRPGLTATESEGSVFYVSPEIAHGADE